jgi:hypothetical protein
VGFAEIVGQTDVKERESRDSWPEICEGCWTVGHGMEGAAGRTNSCWTVEHGLDVDARHMDKAAGWEIVFSREAGERTRF